MLSTPLTDKHKKGSLRRLPFLLVIYQITRVGFSSPSPANVELKPTLHLRIHNGRSSGRDNLDRIGMYQHFGTRELAVDRRLCCITELMCLLQWHVVRQLQMQLHMPVNAGNT